MKKLLLGLIGFYAFVAVNGQAGTLDPTFGKGGIVQTDFTNTANESARRVVLQAKGKAVVLFTARNEWWVARYFSNGNKDLNFTDYSVNFNNGFVRLTGGTAFQAADLALQMDGSILIAGTAAGERTHFSLIRLTPDGAPDEGFGNNGQVVTAFTANSTDSASAIAVQPDGKIVVAGTTYANGHAEFAVARYLMNGMLDNTFSYNGRATTAFPSGYAVGSCVVIQADGKIVVGGSIGTRKRDFALTRFNPDGSHDLSFSVDSKAYTDFSSGDDVLKSLAMQGDGKVIAGGYTTRSGTDMALARYKTNGTLDTSFGVAGKRTTDISGGSADTLQSVALQQDGKIVAGGFIKGTDGYRFALLRYLADGSIDPSFGTNGKQITDLGTTGAIAHQLIVLPDDRILMAGQAGTVQTDLAVARFTASGQPDPTLKGNGRLLDYLKGSSTYYAMAVQRDGKVLAGGFMSDHNTQGQHHDYALARYLINGQLDPTFGKGGKITQHFSNTYNEHTYITEIALQQDGKIVVAGSAPNSETGTNDYELSRYNTNGTLDTSFGTKGILFMDFGGSEDEANGLLIQPDGKIVVSGSARGGSHPGIGVARCFADGRLDNAFGTGGKKVIEVGESEEDGPGAESYASALQPDGKIVLGGRVQTNEGRELFLAVRINADGALDKTFSSDGIRILNFENDYWASVITIALQTDGKIVLVGYPNFTIARLNPNGSLDKSFSNNGWVRTVFGTGDEQSFGVAVQSDGKIIAGGSAGLAIALARYNPDGTLDNTFAAGGLQRTDVSPQVDHFQLVQIDGNRLYGAGFTRREYGDPEGPETGIGTVGAYNLGLGSFTYYRDVDQDGYGNLHKPVTAAHQPFGYVLDHTDCNDNDPDVHPGAGGTNNCDGDANAVTNSTMQKIQVITSEHSGLQLTATPNPTREFFRLRIESGSNQTVQLRIADVAGRVIELRPGLRSGSSVQIGQNYPAGIYYAQVLQDGKQVVVKLIKQPR